MDTINTWYYEGLNFFKKWLKTKDETTWGAFVCCSAVLANYDKNHSNTLTQNLQRLVWNFGYLKGDCTEENVKNSGYFDEKIIADALK